MTSKPDASEQLTPMQKAAATIARLNRRIKALENPALQPVAVVGLACRAPGADSAEALWENLFEGRASMREVPPERWDVNRYFDPRPGVAGKSCTRIGGFIDGVDEFDAHFFGISAREAEGMDPQQRILLECAWHSFEDAGIRPSTLKGGNAGVFVGVTATDYGMLQCDPDNQRDVNPYFNTGTPQNVCAGRISYLFGLQGPSLAVDTACSSSLTAIHLACQSLRDGESELALAGGVNLTLTPLLYSTLSAAGMLSVDGHCKSFDSTANGYARGEGCGLIVLKRLADAQRDGDEILGLIRGSVLNQDGASSGLTVPNGVAQQRLIRECLDRSGLGPADIDYVEAHGTGTPLGDPIEVRALGRVLGQAVDREAPLRIGSIKSNIGHLESAAGVLSVIKVLLALRHECLPKTLLTANLNPEIDWSGLNITPLTERSDWQVRQDRPRRAGVSSFGASGSNAHLVIEEPPATSAADASSLPERALVLPVSAKCQASLRLLARDYATRIACGNPESLQAIAAGAANRRDPLTQRAAVVARSPADVNSALTALAEGERHPALLGPVATPQDDRTVFVFTGQGDVTPGMGQPLYREFPAYREALDACAELLGDRVGLGLREILDPSNATMPERASWAQPALFSLQYALVQLWRSVGVTPAAVVGHSLGEFAAAVSAGALSLADALTAVIGRARLMETLSEPGAMMAVLSDTATVSDVLATHGSLDVDLAVVNGPDNCVLAGLPSELRQLKGVLSARGIRTAELNVTHGFHSRAMDPILTALGEQFADLDTAPMAVPYFSSLEGRCLAADERLDADYWQRHSRQTVRFSDAVAALTREGYRRFLEIGPGGTATGLVKRIATDAVGVSSLAEGVGDAPFQAALSRLWCDGQTVDWRGLPGYRSGVKTDLPLYPFNRQKYWIGKSVSGAQTEHEVNTEMTVPEQPKPDRAAILSQLLQLFSELLRLPAASIDPQAQLIEVGADSLVLVSGVNAIENQFGVKLEIRQLFEEVTTLDAIADYLVANGQPPAVEAASASSTRGSASDNASSGSAATGRASPVADVESAAAEVSGFQPGDGLAQLIAAQTRLMAKHLELLQAAGQSGHAASATASRMTDTDPSLQHPRRQPEVTTSPSDDRSSPLRALNQPLQPVKSTLDDRQQAHMDALVERYSRRTAESKRLAQASRPVLADSRASVGFRFSTKEILYPITGVESSGSHIRDVDGNDYVDLTMGFGVLLFGSKPEHMAGVLEAELAQGFQLGPRSRHMEEIGQLFSELTGHDRVAFTNSGTEAVMTAIRLARAATGRDKIIIFEGAYNGHSDGTLAKRVVGADGAVHAEPVSPGIPQSVADDCIVVEYGADESLAVIRQHAHELGAVLVEPVQSRRLDLQPVEFLKKLRALTTELDIALIFDEMITGFRVHPGGIQGLWGIRADLATYGKILGGGVAIGAVAGESRFMDGIDGGLWQYGDNSYPAARRTYFGGTFCQHPLAMAGCLATLRALHAHGPALQEGLSRRTADFAETLNEFFRSEQLDIRVVYFGSLFTFRFPGNLEIFFYHLLEKGVYIWEWRACFLSLAHTDDDLEHVLRAVVETVKEMRDGGFLPPAAAAGGAKAEAALESPVTATSASVPDESATAFSLYFFGNYDASYAKGKYDLLVDACRYADERGYEAIWLPERHFDKFGGFSPNPSVLAAALARETSHIKLRAGSVVLPLHHPVRVAEEWALVDNLSDGRVGIAFATGWHPNDFALAPENFEHNRDITFQNIEVVRTLWGGDPVAFKGGNGEAVDLGIFPRPKQAHLPCWLTVVGNPDTYRKAGELGAGILTNLLGQSLEDLEENLKVYRQTWLDHGHDPDDMSVTILLHTYLQADAASAIEAARQPMSNYLMSSLSLFQKMADTLPQGLRDIKNASESDKAYVIGKAYERYVAERALIGSPESCRPMVERLVALGVTEIACFLDFGVDGEQVMSGLPHIDTLKSSLAPVPVRQSVPASEAQRQLWLLAKLDDDANIAYNDPALVAWHGAVDEAVLAQVMTEIMARHESLRSTLSEDGQQLRIHPEPLCGLDCVDFRSAVDPSSAANSHINEILAKPLSLSQGPLFQPLLLRLADDRALLLLHSHHIITDGPSMGVLIREMSQLYQARLAGKGGAVLPPSYQFREFDAWQRQARQSGAMAEHRAYWLRTLASLPPPLELPYDRPRPPVRSWRGQRISMNLGAGFSRDVEQAARDAGVTVYMFLHAAFTGLLHRWSGADDIVLGAASSGRAVPGSESMVGYGVHLMPLRSRISGATRAMEHLAEVRASLLDAYDHQAYPFAWLLDDLDIARDPSRPPLINVIFNYERLPAAQRIGDAELRPGLPPLSRARVDLTLTINHIGDEMEWVADFNSDLFATVTVERLLAALELVINAFRAAPERRLMELPLLADSQALQCIQELNDAEAAPSFVPLHRLIEQQAQRVPEAPAVRVLNDPENTMDFATLNQRANALAARLSAMTDGTPERAAICLGHSPNLMVALLGCLKAGTAYVPLDPAYPAERLAFLCADAGVGVLITDRAGAVLLDKLDAPRCLIDDLGEDDSPAQGSTRNPEPRQCAYIIYTSGSTGQPKGVAVTHEGLSNYVAWAAEAYAADTGDGAPLLCSVGFDAAVTSLFAPLVSGKPTVLLAGENELEALRQLAETEECYSFLKLTPAHLEILNRYREAQQQPNGELARFLVLGGEALPAAFATPWLEATDTVVVNEYGPTETVVGCCVYRMTDPAGGNVPIGRPIRGTQLYVLDENLNPVLPGMQGELCIGGAGVALGYLNRPAATAQAFVPDPFGSGSGDSGRRVYRTGDLVKLGEGGQLEFVGRSDAQLKLNGFRIEPGEIEAALLRHPAICQAGVVIRVDESGGRGLVAFVASDSELPVDELSIKSLLRGYLPLHMIPGRVVKLDALPLTSHGKIDRTALDAVEVPRFDGEVAAEQKHPPRSSVERRIADVWRRLLSREDFGTRDNFFDLGGSSLTLLEAHAQLADVLPPDCDVIALFRHPTISGLARFASDGAEERPAAPPSAARARAARQLDARRRRKR